MARFGTPLLGQTEKALNAILLRELDGAMTEHEWIALTLTVMSDGQVAREDLLRRIAAVLKLDDATPLVRQLAAKGLVDDAARIRASSAGRAFFARIRARVEEITDRLWGDVPDDELQAAGSVLATVLERANAELAAGKA